MPLMILSPLARPDRRAAVATPSMFDSLPVSVFTGTLLFLVMTLAKVMAVWRTGIFYGPDDAMRAVEVRDFLNGQGWFDLVPHRLSPDHPFPMHWSRLADVPLAAGILLFRCFMDGDTAERLTRLIEPVLFFVLLLCLLCRLGRDLCGPRGPIAVALLAAGSLEILGDFMPGRIHHHALQILLLAAMVKCLCDGFDPARVGRLALAGALAALTLGINLQNMPFVAVTAAVVGMAWVVRGPALFGPGLQRFGLGLALGAATVFLVQVPPAHYLAATCDAFGTPHLLAATIGGGLFVLLGVLADRFTTPALRCAALALAGACVLAALAFTYPACLGDPYGGVDPMIREGWMAEVGEAMPLIRLLARDPLGTVPIIVALVLGIAGIGAATYEAQETDRSRWLAIGLLAIVAVAGTFWQNRVAASAQIFAALGGAWMLCRLFQPSLDHDVFGWTPSKDIVIDSNNLEHDVVRKPVPTFRHHALAPRQFVTLLAFVTGLTFTQAGWTAAATWVRPSPTLLARSGAGLDPVDPEACFEPSAYKSLARLPPGLVLSSIDEGAHILAHTPHDAIAAPYHRDAYGLRLALEVFGATPDAARKLVVDSKADYVALCTASPEVRDLVRTRPEGFAARILDGRGPDWLTPMEGSGPFRLFAVRPD